MNIPEMIAEWRKGCGNSMFDENGKAIAMHLRPGLCEECTVALIQAIERKALQQEAARGGN